MAFKKVPLGGIAASALLVAASGAWAQQQPAQPQQQPQQQQPAQQPPQAQQQQQPPQQQPAQQQPAQQQQPPQAQQQQPAQPQQVAQQCMNELQALNQQMERDGFWLAGWGTRWGTPAQPMTGRAPDRSPAMAPETTGAAPPATAPGAQSPWGDQQFGLASPRYQVRVLHSATQVLAHRGDEQACQQVLAQTRAIYDGHVEQLRQAGVEPGQVTTWRQDRIAGAQPVQQLQVGGINIDNVTGTEVRNAADQRLGTINDVIIDPQSGQISYVIVDRGGFFGIGADDVPVPWNALRATPDLNLFVLNVSDDVFEQAPQLTDAGWFQEPTMHQQERQQVDQFWQKHTAG
jgi:sporulation protein YlmC with PRC-barrel domain